MNENDLLRAILSLCQQWVTNTSGSPPVNTVAPVLTSNADINTVYPGDILSCSTGTWTNSPTGYTYAFKWQDGTVVQTGAGHTYSVATSDIGHTIHCTVTASNGSGSGTADSNTSGSVISANTAPPLIDNTSPQVGETLYGFPGTWLNSPTLTYQWAANGIPIGGATGLSYLLTGSEEGKNITFLVTDGTELVQGGPTDTVQAAASGPCVLKLYADNISGSIGDPVATWVDQSGYGNNATQPTMGWQPTLQAGPNGHKSIEGDGVAVYMSLFDMSAMTGAHMFFVFKNAVNGTGDNIYVMTGANAVSYLPYSGTGGIYDYFFSTVRKDNFDIGGLASGWNLYEPQSSSGSWKASVNGTQVFSTGTNTVSAPSTPLILGDGAHPCDSFIAAILIFNAPLGASDQANVQAFMKAYFGTP